MSVNEHPTRPPRDPGTVSHHLLYEFTTGFDRFTNGSEIDEMLADILIIYLDQSLSFSQKNGNSLTWVLVALPVCPTSPLRPRDSAEPRPHLAGEWEL
jgi:hypothetical protein